MDVEILIHGVPNGHDYYGPKEEQNTAGSFYITSQETIKFVVETKKNGNKPYVYYSYLRYKGVVGAEGRTVLCPWLGLVRFRGHCGSQVAVSGIGAGKGGCVLWRNDGAGHLPGGDQRDRKGVGNS